MENTITIRIGKSLFFYRFTKDGIDEMMNAWWEFFETIRNAKGGISARNWKYPAVVMNGKVVGKVAPNGRWHE